MSKVKLDLAQDQLMGLGLTPAAVRELDGILHSYHIRDITDSLLRSMNSLIFFIDKGCHKTEDLLLILDLVAFFRSNEPTTVTDDETEIN